MMKKLILVYVIVVATSHFATDFFKASDAGIKRFLSAAVSAK
jgi:hypothetical protein